MPEDPKTKNLSLFLGDFGPLYIQPRKIDSSDIGTACFVLFPEPISDKDFASAVEWVATSESPVFCTARDLQRFVEEGFGAYRFNVLGGFKELGFEKGTLSFFPARQKKSFGIKGFLREWADAWGLKKREAFHVVARSPKAGTAVYLATPFIDKSEWSVLTENKPQKVYGSSNYPALYWLALSERLAQEIIFDKSEYEQSETAHKIFGKEQEPQWSKAKSLESSGH